MVYMQFYIYHSNIHSSPPKAMGYGAWVGAWVGGKRPSHHPGWAWVGVWPLGLGFQAGRGAVWPC
ncbi:hypothetical protein Hanom_Chr03g00233921 [Helianthus anomalus]